MADQPQSSISKLIAQETEQQRVERVRVEERKRHAARTAEELEKRFGVADE
jgi:hypothetical protein